MKWTVEYSADAVEFVDREDLSGQVSEQIALFLKRMRGQAVNIDAKKLKGKCQGLSDITSQDMSGTPR